MEDQRQFITNYNSLTLQSPPPVEWFCQNGTVMIINQELRLPPGSNKVSTQIINEEWSCQQKGMTYDGKRLGWKTGKKP